MKTKIVFATLFVALGAAIFGTLSTAKSAADPVMAAFAPADQRVLIRLAFSGVGSTAEKASQASLQTAKEATAALKDRLSPLSSFGDLSDPVVSSEPSTTKSKVFKSTRKVDVSVPNIGEALSLIPGIPAATISDIVIADLQATTAPYLPTGSFERNWGILYLVTSLFLSLFSFRAFAAANKGGSHLTSIDVGEAMLQMILRVPALIFAALAVHNQVVSTVIAFDLVIRILFFGFVVFKLHQHGLHANEIIKKTNPIPFLQSTFAFLLPPPAPQKAPQGAPFADF